MFFSNRSAAYLSKGDATNALSDAQRCIQLSPTWPKGYSRQGAALHSLRRYDEAVEIYNKGTIIIVIVVVVVVVVVVIIIDLVVVKIVIKIITILVMNNDHYFYYCYCFSS